MSGEINKIKTNLLKTAAVKSNISSQLFNTYPPDELMEFITGFVDLVSKVFTDKCFAFYSSWESYESLVLAKLSSGQLFIDEVNVIVQNKPPNYFHEIQWFVLDIFDLDSVLFDYPDLDFSEGLICLSSRALQ